MSIILKGIDLPKSKDNRYVIQIYSNGEIHIAEEVWDDTKKGHDKLHIRYIGKSEAVQISKGHGRLIDGDALISDLRIYESKYCGEQGYITQDDIIDAPTILEAEEDE